MEHSNISWSASVWHKLLLEAFGGSCCHPGVNLCSKSHVSAYLKCLNVPQQRCPFDNDLFVHFCCVEVARFDNIRSN